MPDRTPLDDYEAQLCALAEAWLRPYLSSLAAGKSALRAKEINDAVWGTLQIRPEELAFLDSPLLQRLRRIKQLGVVHYVYPAATHTRLEHSLGVMHQVQRLIRSINEHGLVRTGVSNDGRHQRVVSDEMERTLRLAALCHDIGHGFMSHVSEYGLDTKPECLSLRTSFMKATRRPAVPQLSEMAAYYLIGSPAFGELCTLAARRAGLHEIVDLQERLQALVMGRPIDGQLILIHELISGPFDADKLDYLTRDAMMCGVPRITDVPRLVQKVRAAEVAHDQLTEHLRRAANSSQTVLHVTGIARSGARTLDELALARTLMFDKVYRHQKVRAVESMVFGIVLELTSLLPNSALVPFALTDDEVVGLDQDKLCTLVGQPYSQMSALQKASVDTVCSLAKRLRNRDLFGRGLAFAAVMTGDAYVGDPEHTSGIKIFLEDCGVPERRAVFVSAVAERVRRIDQLLDLRTKEVADDANLSTYLWLSPPKAAPKTMGSDTGHAHLIDAEGRLTQVEHDAAETMPWADAYVATRDLGHLFCPIAIAPLVYVAGEAELRSRYMIRLPESMLQYSKQDRTAIDQLKKRLLDTVWYQDLPADLRPLPPVLDTWDAQARASEIRQQLQTYAGPSQAANASTDSHRQTSIREEQVFAFVRQFEQDELVDTAMLALSRLMVIGRSQGNNALRQFMLEHPDFHGASYCTLGGAKDSSSLLTYFVGDVAPEFGLIQRELTEALNTSAPIVFIDDFVGSGSQVTDIFEASLGLPRTRQLGEGRSGLVKELAERLRARRIGLVFVAGLDEGKASLIDFFARQSMNATVHVQIPESELPFLHTIGLHPERLRDFQEFCREKARELLPNLWGKPRTQEWVEGKLLGYGNTGLLLSSTFNTQTATLTCLWAQAEGVPWRPLLPRRTKR